MSLDPLLYISEWKMKETSLGTMMLPLHGYLSDQVLSYSPSQGFEPDRAFSEKDGAPT